MVEDVVSGTTIEEVADAITVVEVAEVGDDTTPHLRDRTLQRLKSLVWIHLLILNAFRLRLKVAATELWTRFMIVSKLMSRKLVAKWIC